MSNSEQISEQIRQLILDHTFSGDQLPTESELIDRFGVSRYAIRKATDDLQQQGIIRKVQGGGMFLNTPEANKTPSKTVALISRHLIGDSETLTRLDQQLTKKGYTLILTNALSRHTPEQERQQIQRFEAMGVDAIILEPSQSVSSSANIDLTATADRNHVPTIFVYSGYPFSGNPVVAVNDEEAEAQATSRIIKAGHNRLLGVFSADDIRNVRRMNGFVRSYQQHPEIAANSYMETYRASEGEESILAKVKNMFTRLPEDMRPTAVLAGSDQLAARIQKTLQRMKFHIPEDVVIVGFGDDPLCQFTTPSLSTITYDKEAFVEYLVDQVMLSISGLPTKSKSFKTTLIPRASSEQKKHAKKY